ncbi:MAG: bifunctional 4-hydroxy-2-oxoglutarate aldolase/2-dehydro-3-deoxy-phosphogluconate aldolase [Pseudomonadota bacterium]
MAFKDWNDLDLAAPVIPVIVIDDPASAVPLAETLVAHGLFAIEITLRTAAALPSIEAIARAVPQAIVGAGTVLDAGQVQRVQDAGGRFLVSPGATLEILQEARERQLPILPGAQTMSEIMTLRSAGYAFLKFFPAHLLGGDAFLKTVAGVIPDVSFCPTGGVSMRNAKDYLASPNVPVVGGSWIAPRERLASGAWTDIAARAKAAVEELSAKDAPTVMSGGG